MKKIIIGPESRKNIKKGIDKCVDVVKGSMGKYGNNVLIYNGQTSEIINDGVSIAKSVEVKDEIEQAGIQLAKQCADATNQSAGDGTTTTLVLLQAILNEIITDFQTENPRKLREKLFEEAKKVLENVEVKHISSKEDVYNIALTSCLNENIARIISDVYFELGKDAKITIEEVQKDTLESEIVRGIQFDSKKADSKIIKGEEKVIEEDIHVLVGDILTQQDIQSAVNNAVEDKKTKLVLISNQFDRNQLISMMSTKGFTFIPVEYKEFRPIEDVKDYVGLEKVEKVIITDETTTIIGGKGDIESKIKLLKEKKEETNSNYDKELIDSRIASLSSGVAVIKIGKQTDVERNEYVLKIEDALGAVKGSYEEGYSKGGGIALLDASSVTEDARMKSICASPYNQICDNAGFKVEVDGTVIDSFKTIRESLLNALSTATSILTVEALLIEEREDE